MRSTATGGRDRAAGPPAAAVRRSGGVGRAATPAGEAVSDHLRRGRGELVERRRRTAALSLAGTGALALVALYQFGIVKHLPDPPVPFLDSDEVDAAGEAYALGQTPDAALGIVSYGVTAALAGMGGAGRARERPWLPLALAAKVLLDAAGGAWLTLEQATRHRKFCLYCLVAAGTSLAAVPQVLPEARLALRELRRRTR